ncbi:MAG: DUF4892 domain-containing protein [Halioglobus sp.]|nr:DUF4892 domain-containing protein [Halioglobus sp.]
MSRFKSIRAVLYVFGYIGAIVCLPAISAEPTPEALLQTLNEYPHAKQIAFLEAQVIDHEVGLGAIQKVRGKWRFKNSERLTGTLFSYTWQIVDGFTSAEVMEELLGSAVIEEGASELFTCNGRACGHGSQWANRIFGQRVLYGREDMQRYRVYALEKEVSYRMIVYSSSRTADRQYLHVELLRIAD